MQTHSLFEQSPPLTGDVNAVPFRGAGYDERRDRERLTSQLECLIAVVKDERWRTVERLTLELRRAFPGVRFPENSVSAQIRNLKKIGYRVERRNSLDFGLLSEYRILPPVNPGVGRKAVKHG